MGKIYLDHSATTPVRPEAAQIITHFLMHAYGNPSSAHSFGREAREGLATARRQVAELIGAAPEEITFTSGGTEADNLAILGAALNHRGNRMHLITTAIEHHAVLHTFKYLESKGFRVTILPVDREGIVRLGDVENALTEDTLLISVMHANNEVGTIQPIAQIGSLAQSRGVLFHTDAVQSLGKIPVDVAALHVDLLSGSGHKLYGPKGTGFLYIRKGIKLSPLAFGGGQERKLRAGTENIPGIAGLGKAAELAALELDQEARRLTALRDSLAEGLIRRIPGIRINGHRTLRIPTNVHVSVPGVEGESLLLSLNAQGIAASSGSACTTGSQSVSHVLAALGLGAEEAQGSIRLTLGRDSHEDDIKRVLAVFPAVVERLRSISPVF